ncbi:MAG: trypsin-like serine protease [Planctomycetaceae bacterium]|nr:trypsin-like serine protease [Planctomycetaceae bacterium]
MSFSEITRKIANSLSGLIFNEKKHKKAVFQHRRLHIDPLEERQLLSVNVVMPQEKILTPFTLHSSPTISASNFFINNSSSYGGAQYTETYWSNDYMASNNQGDTVITWTQNDFVYRMDVNGNYVRDANGNPIRLTDNFGNYYDDYNIYAQYLTNQVERITLPAELLDNLVSNVDSSFKVIYAPYTVQQLSIKSVTTPGSYGGTGTNIVMDFRLGGIDMGDGVERFTDPIRFDENQSPVENAREIELALQNLGRYYGYELYMNVKVTAESSTDFMITFETDTSGVAVPELQVRDSLIIQGTYPGVLISTVSAPIVLTTLDSWGNDQGILINPGNPQQTAERIQQAFNSVGVMSPFPRVETYTRDIQLNPYGENVNVNYRPSYDVFYTPEVSVVYAGLSAAGELQFDITFINSGGLSLHSIAIVSARDEFGTDWSNKTSTATVKQSSDAFRVNAPETNDPTSSVPLVTNQMNPSVAMDADGDFVITWQSEAATTGTDTITDIYARRFSPQGVVPDDKITFYNDGYSYERYVGGVSNNPVQGVRPVGDEFKVNSFSNSYATQPSIGMDPDGNFVIAWSVSYQRTSDGNAIYARYYDRYGNALTDSVILANNMQTTLIQPTVAISNDGYAAISWVASEDTNVQHLVTVSSIYMSIFAPGTLNPLPGWDATQVVATNYSPHNPSLSFDPHNTLLFTYTDHYADFTSINTIKGSYGAEMSDVLARVYELQDGTYVMTRGDFRVHSQGNWIDNSPYDSEAWRGPQYNGVGQLDSDGDMVFIYQGYGPDSNMSYNTTYYSNYYLPDNYGYYSYYYYIDIPGSFFEKYLNSTKNADLLKYFNPLAENFVYGSTDVDVAVRYYLNRAVTTYQGTPNQITNEQLGRLNAIFESVAGMLRGGANDVFTTRINKGDFLFAGTEVAATSSDANVTSTRDGVNSHWYILIPNFVENPMTAGGIQLYITTEFFNAIDSPNMQLGFEFTNQVFRPDLFLWTLNRSLNSMDNNGFYAHNDFTDILAPGISTNPVGMIMPSAEVTYYAPGEFEYLFSGFYSQFNTYTVMDYLNQSQYYTDINGYHVYEIVFVGGAHDLQVSLSYGNGSTMTRQNMQGNVFQAYFVTEQYGYRGAEKGTPGLSVLPNGSYVTSWFTDITTTDGTVVDRKINYRYFYEDSDNVGPKVTDVILPNGQYVANQDTITYALDQIVLTFDEELLANGTNGLHSVLNPSNWAIIKDGVKLNNAIKSISFGMNKAADIIAENPGSIVADSVLSYGSNKWEVVIEFTQPLGTGSYELVATNMITDTSGVRYERGQIVYGNGNALGADGTNANGQNFTRNFSINAIDGTLSFYGGSAGYVEKLVSDGGGDHYTRTDATLYDTPSNPTSVATDHYGNFVTVWTAEGVGIMAKIYRQEFIDTANGRESVITLNREIMVTGNTNASYASVAMDADGDFVVTWMQDDLDGSRNIYAKAFNFNGTVRMDADGNPTSEFRVNSHLGGTHSYPAIAMDLTGGFVITWESLNQVSKTSGYDIYYQRYDSACSPIGGSDEIQAIQFVGGPSAGGTFVLQYYDEVAGVLLETSRSNPIRIETSIQKTAENIQSALRAIGLDVDVAASSSDTILVQFTRTMGTQKMSPLMVPAQYMNLLNPKAGQSIILTVRSSGVTAEERANDTTQGDKRYPSIAMTQTGEFIITWTSWGQGADSPYETNIYAKNFASNDAVATRNNQVTLAERIEIMDKVNRDDLKIVTSDAYNNHLTGSTDYTGVVMVELIDDDGNYLGHGSGSLLSTGMHILTAAHVTCDAAGNPLPATSFRITFVLPNGTVSRTVSLNTVHASWTGDAYTETDLAILTLSEIAPAGAERYDIYRGSDEIGSVQTTVGFGATGTGNSGDIVYDFQRRWGQNRYDAVGSIFSLYGFDYSPNLLVYDVDSGSPQNDAFGYYFGIYNTGLGSAYESTSAHGDSGGPAFINGQIAGVVSWGSSVFYPSVTDIDINPTNCSFGEFSFDVRVSVYADWIDSVLVVGGGAGEYLVNQTETGDQIWSDVAISASGEVIFTWTSFNQDNAGDGPGGSNTGLAGVYARRFDMQGSPMSGAFGLDPDDPDNYDPDTGELIIPDGVIVFGDEFLVNDYIVGNQWHSSVSIANNGDFLIVWESWQDKHEVNVTLPNTGYGVGGTTIETVTDYGIYAKRYTNLATLLRSQDNPGTAQYGLPDNTRFVPGYGYVGIHGEIGKEFRVNTNIFIGDQTGATVTLNANGDAIVVFQSNDEVPAGIESNVYYRALPLQVDRSAPIVTETVLIYDELERDENGEFVFDNDGNPVVTSGGEDTLMTIRDGSIIYGLATQMIVTFSEEMVHAFLYDPTSVLNTGNWQLLKGSVAINGAVVNVEFGLNKANELWPNLVNKTGKWEAVLTFDTDLALPGNQPLTSGLYTLLLRDTVTDLEGNRLDGNYSGTSGGSFTRDFQIVVPSTSETGLPDDDDQDHSEGPSDLDKVVISNTEYGNDKPAIASANDGSYVVVAVHYGIPGSINEPGGVLIVDPDEDIVIGFIGNIVMQRYDKNGVKVGVELIVNDYMTGHQTDPDVAMDSNGNIAIVWSGAGSRSDNGVYLRLYDSYGKPLGDQIWVNEVTTAVCSTPKVAYDDNGNILVTWIEYNSTTRSNVIMSRVYNNQGVLQSVSKDGAAATRTSMLLVGENSRGVMAYDIAFSPDGHLIMTWQIHDTATNSQDIYAKVLQYTNGKLNTTVQPFRVNQYTSQTQARPSVAASNSGFVITWASERQAANSLSFDVYARRFNMNGVAQSILGTTGDALINSQKAVTERSNPRDYPDVSMAANGSFVITWSSFDQEPNNFDELLRRDAHDYGAFARAFNSNGNELVTDFTPNTSTKEFRLNYTMLGNQMYSVATIWNAGMAFAWVGDTDIIVITDYDDDGFPTEFVLLPSTDVYARTYSVGARTAAGQGQGLSSGLSNRSSYSLTQQSGGGGYAGLGKSSYKYDNLDTLFLDATGSDVFEIIVTAAGTFQVTVNGKTQTVSANVTNIHISGTGGQDSVTVTTAKGDNSAKFNSDDNNFTLSVDNGKLSISATRVNTIELNAGGINNTINVIASGNDVLTLGVGELSLAGNNTHFAATGFETVIASASGSLAKAVLFDSAGDDILTMSPGKAVMKGQDFEHSVSGFSNITAYSSRGNNTATLNGSAGDDAVFAASGMVSMTGSGYKNTIFGFEKVDMNGNGGNDSATIVGSYAADRFNASDSSATATFGLGGSVNLYGFNRFTIHGNGGNDVVNLGGASLSSTAGTTKVYSNKMQTYTVVGVNDVRGIQTAAPVAAASAFSALEDDIYQLLAMEQNSGSKTNFDGQDDELDIDFLLSTGAI